MLSLLQHLFSRYAYEKLVLEKPGFDLIDEAGTTLGHLDYIRQKRSQIEVEGWALATHVSLISNADMASTKPDLVREDVTAAFGDSAGQTPGFRLSLSKSGDRFFFIRSDGSLRHIHPVSGFGQKEILAAKRRLVWPFLKQCLTAIPHYLRWRVLRHSQHREQIKAALGLSRTLAKSSVMADLFCSQSSNHFASAESVTEPVTIILPVFNALDLLPEVLIRVLKHTDLPFQLIVVEDCSTNPEVRPFLRKWQDGLDDDVRETITLIENVENLGFIGSVNTALELALKLGRHVVLLNSDAFVPRGWVSRLIAPLLQQTRVASVTPMSNDAEIFTVPVMCKGQTLPEGAVDVIDDMARTFQADTLLQDAPTGVGFCMAMHIDALRAVPSLDPAFNPGYGEEVDWCQRVQAQGWRHLGHGGLFVEHRSGTSFGTEKKAKLVEAHNRIISHRYPEFDQSVQDFIVADPLIAPRLALALAWASHRQNTQIPVYLAHALGGGAEHYLENRINQDLRHGVLSVVLRVGGAEPWQIELHTPDGVTRGETRDLQFAKALINIIDHKHIVYSCGVGAQNVAMLPELLIELASGRRSTLEILFHDYLPLSPSYTLLDSKGRYDPMFERKDAEDDAHIYVPPDGTRVGLKDWREMWLRPLEDATTVTVFSENSKKIVSQIYPSICKKITVTPHSVPDIAHPRPEIDGTAPLIIGVLGAIGVQKGAKILQDLSVRLEETDQARLVVIGYVDPSYPLAASTQVHGPYDTVDVAALTKRYRINSWLIPSIWPETFSYTTHEALATGLPVWSFDIGAQADAIRKTAHRSGLGGCLPLKDGRPDVSDMLDTMLSAHRRITCPLSQSA